MREKKRKNEYYWDDVGFKVSSRTRDSYFYRSKNLHGEEFNYRLKLHDHLPFTGQMTKSTDTEKSMIKVSIVMTSMNTVPMNVWKPN